MVSRLISTAIRPGLVVLVALALGLLVHATCTAQAALQAQPGAKSECDPDNLRATAPTDGYGLNAAGRYCDGLVVEQHSAPSLQIISFSMATEPLAGAKILVLRTPLVGGQSGQVIRGRNLSGVVAYRFDARVRDTRPFELDLGRVAAKHNVDATSMAFVGEALVEGASHLIPVAIGRTAGQTAWPSKYLLTIRLSSAAASIKYAVLHFGGAPLVAKGTLDGPIAADDPVSIPIDASKPGAFRLNIEVQGLAGSDNAGSTAFTRRIYIGSAK